MSKIEWTDTTWNPTTGCTKVSQGCKFCYAEVMHKRLNAMGLEKYAQPFRTVVTHESELKKPYGWKKPRFVFVNSMSDLLHEDIPDAFIQKVFKVMNDNPKHTFQLLTKRAVRISSMDNLIKWTPNIWMGVSVESRQVLSRVDCLRQCSAQVRFLSCEPLIGSLSGMNLEGIGWVIVGGESGRGSIREMKEEWVLEIQNMCYVSKVPFFFKQWGGHNKQKSGRLLEGRTCDEMPSVFLKNKN